MHNCCASDLKLHMFSRCCCNNELAAIISLIGSENNIEKEYPELAELIDVLDFRSFCLVIYCNISLSLDVNANRYYIFSHALCFNFPNAYGIFCFSLCSKQ